MTLSARELLEDLEKDPSGTDLFDLDELLRGCGYQRYDYSGVYLYHHEKLTPLTFPRSKLGVPVSRLMGILGMLRNFLEREGQL